MQSYHLTQWVLFFFIYSFIGWVWECCFKGRYSKYYFLNNRLAGVIMIGDLSDMVKITEALEKHALYKDVLG